VTEEDIEITCPSCRNNIQATEHDSEIQCGTCGDLVLLTGHMCPVCSAYHEEDEIVCLRCGTSLSQVCQSCRHVNWSGREYCFNCGESIDLLSRFVSHGGRTTADRLHEQMNEVSLLKQEEESASIDRMSEMLAIEEQRQAEIRKRVSKRKQDERRMIIIVAAAIAFFLLVVVILAIVGAAN
jgi:hypothetical protein